MPASGLQKFNLIENREDHSPERFHDAQQQHAVARKESIRLMFLIQKNDIGGAGVLSMIR
jgi:hypothetical protein